MLVFGKNVALEYLNSDKKIYKALYKIILMIMI